MSSYQSVIVQRVEDAKVVLRVREHHPDATALHEFFVKKVKKKELYKAKVLAGWLLRDAGKAGQNLFCRAVRDSALFGGFHHIQDQYIRSVSGGGFQKVDYSDTHKVPMLEGDVTIEVDDPAWLTDLEPGTGYDTASSPYVDWTPEGFGGTKRLGTTLTMTTAEVGRAARGLLATLDRLGVGVCEVPTLGYLRWFDVFAPNPHTGLQNVLVHGVKTFNLAYRHRGPQMLMPLVQASTKTKPFVSVMCVEPLDGYCPWRKSNNNNLTGFGNGLVRKFSTIAEVEAELHRLAELG